MLSKSHKAETAVHHPFRFAIAATFTAEPLRPAIAFWGKTIGMDVEICFAPYNQVLQTLLDPGSDFGTNTNGIDVVLARLSDLGDASQIEANILSLGEELRAAPARLHVPLIFCLCPSVHNEARWESLIESALEEAPGVQFVSYRDVERLYPVDEVHDPGGERLGRIPYTDAFFAALGTALVRRTHALIRAPFKLIALDCDNTLWDGICGEDGPEGVTLDAPRRALHDAMIEQREAGMLLAMASKNNEDDVLETFRVHPEMPLELRHFVTWRLNWEPKADNLLSIAEQIGIGVDTFVFIDDNPKECAELEEALPEVLTLALPEDISQTPHFLDHVWAFDHLVVTEEDRNRSASYARAAEFGNEARRAGSLREFIESLGLRVTITAITPDKLPRAAQLTQRTNQFNTTTIRRTEPELNELLRAGYEIYTTDVADRFGEYGLTGLLIVRTDIGTMTVDSLLLSCRVLGRSVEHRVLSWLGREAVARGIETVDIPYVRTARSSPARKFLESLGTVNPFDSGFTVRMAAAELAELEWKPPTDAPTAIARDERPRVERRAIDYAKIATELSTVPEILAAMRRSAAPEQKDASMSDTERALAQIWAELLEKPAVVATDNFFDLGGHSLLAVLLLLRIRETFGVELSIDDVYSGSLTLADLAARIEAAELGNIDPEEYAALLAEIENLSDEEARELLARENLGQS